MIQWMDQLLCMSVRTVLLSCLAQPQLLVMLTGLGMNMSLNVEVSHEHNNHYILKPIRQHNYWRYNNLFISIFMMIAFV